MRRRAFNRIDRWDGAAYGRTVHVGDRACELSVRQTGTEAAPSLEVRVRGIRRSPAARSAIVALLDRLLGLGLDLAPFYDIARRSPELEPMAMRFRGVRPPRFPTVFEAAVNAICCQQLSLHVGLTLLNRLTAAFGTASEETPPFRAFPRPLDLRSADVPALQRLGFSRNKSLALVALADNIDSHRFDLEALHGLDDEAACRELYRLRGIGRWSAEYVLLRGLGRLHVFPADDVGGRRNLQQWLGSEGPLDYDQTRQTLRRWHPFAGLVYLHLLLQQLAEQGMMTAPGG